MKSILNFLGAVAGLVGLIGLAILSLVLFLALIVMPIEYGHSLSFCEEFRAAELTLKEARKNPQVTPLELAAIQQKVVEYNARLASKKYWANIPILNLAITSKVRALEAIK